MSRVDGGEIVERGMCVATEKNAEYAKSKSKAERARECSP